MYKVIALCGSARKAHTSGKLNPIKKIAAGLVDVAAGGKK
jgi:hypothetical protein